MTAATHQLASGLFVVEDHGAQPLKGFENPVHLCRVIQPAAVRKRTDRALTPFVGREEEMRLALSRWARVREGEGQVLLIVGEAGIGKSRLAEEARGAGKPALAVSTLLQKS